MNLLLKLLVMAIFLLAHIAIAQEPSSVVNVSSSKRIYTTNSIGSSETPVIDGILDDPAWNVVE